MLAPMAGASLKFTPPHDRIEMIRSYSGTSGESQNLIQFFLDLEPAILEEGLKAFGVRALAEISIGVNPTAIFVTEAALCHVGLQRYSVSDDDDPDESMYVYYVPQFWKPVE